MSLLSIFAAALVFLTSAEHVAATRAFPPIWPLPATFNNGTAVSPVDSSSFKMSLGAGTPHSADLKAGFERFVARTFTHRVPSQPDPSVAINTVVVFVANTTVPLQLGVSERYQISIPDSSQGNGAIQITVKADTVYGAYHAFETLSQLIQFNFDDQIYTIRHAPWSIIDAPRFPHRGVLVDTSRHFLPVATLKHVIDSLTYAKFNTMHWHIVDAISFAYDSATYPKFGRDTAYAPSQRFTPSDVQDVVEYARARGIRVMVELDTPGHSAAMCLAYPEICPTPSCNSDNVNNWALDITKNRTYDIVGGLLTEFSGLFPERMMHLGGDEVDPYCWEQTPYIMQWLKERGLTPDGGYEYYVKRVQAIAWGLDREVVGWEEIWNHFGTQLNPKTIIHQWLPNSTSLPLNVTSHGYRLIWSDSSLWYLDWLQNDWSAMYDAEPCNGLPESNCELILGGEGCQWGETVDTSDIMQTIWPRAAAIAERLWSRRTAAVRTETTKHRIMAFRCLLNDRGVAAAPVDNSQARQAPPGPGGCFYQ